VVIRCQRNAKGQRLLITFENGLLNRYTYDSENFRLLRMKAEKYTFSENATERKYSSATNYADKENNRLNEVVCITPKQITV